MRAMILAAGLGTRLGPLTKLIPKALVKIDGKPMLEHIILKLKAEGISHIIINIHHHSDQIREFLRTENNFGCHISLSDESDCLLDSGGGLRKASGFFSDGKDFLLHNVDIFSEAPLGDFIRQHEQNGALATLMVRKRHSSRYLLFDEKDELRGWKNTVTGEIICPEGYREGYREMAFSGIHMISPEIFTFMPEKSRFGMTGLYLDLCGRQRIRAWEDQSAFFCDAGKPESITIISDRMKEKRRGSL